MPPADAPRARAVAPGGRYGMGRRRDKRADKGKGREGMGIAGVLLGDARRAYACISALQVRSLRRGSD